MKQFHFLIILLSLYACEKVVDLDYTPERQVCLNCVLNPDSLVRISLSYTRALDDNTDFIPIENAQINLYEDNKLWTSVENRGKGLYGIDHYPLSGKTYRLEAIVDGEPPLKAETIVPDKPDIDTCIVSRPPSSWYSMNVDDLDVDYTLNDRSGKDYYWNYMVHWYPYWNRYIYNSEPSYLTPYADNFNREIDAETRNGFYYRFYVRQTDDGTDGQAMKFSKAMTTLHIDYFLNADEHYDRYLKSTVQSWIIEEWDDLPFKEPVQIYSNIENGTGIFGSASITPISYRNE